MKKIDINEIRECGKFAVILKCLLTKKHITQGQLAKATGLSGATITNYVKGKSTPSTQTLEKIAEYLNVSPQAFYDDACEYTPYLNLTEKIFSEHLLSLMNQKGISQEELAKEINVSRQTINYYANGKMMPMNDVLSRIADFFDVPVNYFFDDDTHEEECETKILVNKMPQEKKKCPFIIRDYSHECRECKLGGLCALENNKCPHLTVLKFDFEKGMYF